MIMPAHWITSGENMHTTPCAVAWGRSLPRWYSVECVNETKSPPTPHPSPNGNYAWYHTRSRSSHGYRKRRGEKWSDNPTCMFYGQNETVTKCVWSIMDACPGINSIRNNWSQYKKWILNLVPKGEVVHHFDFATICWAIWKCRNKVVFYGKVIKHPLKSSWCLYLFISYGACLFNADFHGGVAEGVKMMLAPAHEMLVQQMWKDLVMARGWTRSLKFFLKNLAVDYRPDDSTLRALNGQHLTV
jgi:hypothetical protein